MDEILKWLDHYHYVAYWSGIAISFITVTILVYNQIKSFKNHRKELATQYIRNLHIWTSYTPETAPQYGRSAIMESLFIQNNTEAPWYDIRIFINDKRTKKLLYLACVNASGQPTIILNSDTKGLSDRTFLYEASNEKVESETTPPRPSFVPVIEPKSRISIPVSLFTIQNNTLSRRSASTLGVLARDANGNQWVKLYGSKFKKLRTIQLLTKKIYSETDLVSIRNSLLIEKL